MLHSIDKIKRKLIEQGKVISFYISNHVQNHLEFEQRQIEWNLSRRWVPEGGLSVSLCAESIIQRSKTINVCLRDKILIILESRPLLFKRSLLARSFVSHKQIVSQLRVTCQIVSQSLSGHPNSHSRTNPTSSCPCPILYTQFFSHNSIRHSNSNRGQALRGQDRTVSWDPVLNPLF